MIQEQSLRALLGGPDLADAGQQFVEVVPAAVALEAFVIHDETLDEVFGKIGGGPLAELGAVHAFDAVADGQDHFEAIELGLALDLARVLGLNRQGFLDGCRQAELALGEDVLDVQAGVLLGRCAVGSASAACSR